MSTTLVVLFLKSIALFQTATAVIACATLIVAPLIVGLRIAKNQADTLDKKLVWVITGIICIFAAPIAGAISYDAGTWGAELLCKMMSNM